MPKSTLSLKRDSIGLRLVVGAAIWIVLTLVITVFLLSKVFRDYVQESFDQQLVDHVEEILILANLDDQGRVILSRHPADPRTNQPYSGWYWTIIGPNQDALRSRSLWDLDLPQPDPLPTHGHDTVATVAGPTGAPLRLLARTITLPGSERDFLFIVTGPQDEVDRSVKRFVSLIAAALAVLGLGLFGSVIAQVIYGLRPLRHVRAALADIGAGRMARLTGHFPSEVQPLVDELNSLLDHNAKVLERARTHVGNLAHALKTPLAVLRNEARATPGKLGETMSKQTEEMGRYIEHHLRRARMAGASGVLGVRTDVAEVVEPLLRTMGMIFNDRPRKGVLEGQRGLFFHGERQDLEELLGNLIENAYKWSAGRVRVTLSSGHNPDFPVKTRIVIAVEDDGPGIPADKRETALGRGKRLDESTPGTGLGLAIVRDLADMYEGAFTLDHSADLGGLKAVLDLPAAAQASPDGKRPRLSRLKNSQQNP